MCCVKVGCFLVREGKITHERLVSARTHGQVGICLLLTSHVSLTEEKSGETGGVYRTSNGKTVFYHSSPSLRLGVQSEEGSNLLYRGGKLPSHSRPKHQLLFFLWAPPLLIEWVTVSKWSLEPLGLGMQESSKPQGAVLQFGLRQRSLNFLLTFPGSSSSSVFGMFS